MSFDNSNIIYFASSISNAINTDDTSIVAVSTDKDYKWADIIKEKEDLFENVNTYLKKLNPTDYTPKNPQLQYLDEYIFPLLLPILKKTLFKAIRMECIKHQKSLFNGIDYISENLWLSNPKYPERKNTKQNIFLMDWVQEWLQNQPRPIFPLSWIWTKEQATVKIQAYMRGHFVRKLNEVQEMRQFWKILIREKEMKNNEFVGEGG